VINLRTILSERKGKKINENNGNPTPNLSKTIRNNLNGKVGASPT